MKARWRRFYWRLRLRLARWGLGLPGKIMYIGGSDVLPAPLNRQEEGESIAALAGQYPGRLLFSPGDVPAFTLKLRKTDDPLRAASQAVERYAALLASAPSAPQET